MLVSGRKPLVLLERVQTRTLEGCISPLACRDVEKTIDRAHQLALRIAKWVNVDGHDQRGPVRVLDDSLDITHRLSCCKHLGNQGTLDRRSVEIGNNSRMPSDARSIALSRDGMWRVPEWLRSSESTIRTPPRGFRSPSPPRQRSGSIMICQWHGRLMTPGYRRKSRSGSVFRDRVCRCRTDPMIDESREPVA